MASQMRSELPEIPTREQRSAVVAELVQSVVKTASHSFDTSKAWMDLPGHRLRSDALAGLIDAVQELGVLAGEALIKVDSEEEVTFAAENTRKSRIITN